MSCVCAAGSRFLLTTAEAAPTASVASSPRRSAVAWALAASMSAAARARVSASSVCRRASWSFFERVGSLTGLLDDPSRLRLGVRQLGLVPVEHAHGLGLGALGRVEVGADPLGASVHAALDGREGELPHQEEQHEERQRAPDELVGGGQDRAGCLVALVDRTTLDAGSGCTRRRASVPPFSSAMSSASWVISSICSSVNSLSSSSCAEAWGAKATRPTASIEPASSVRVRLRTVGLLSPR